MPTIVNEIWIAMADLAHKAKNIKLSVRNQDLNSRVVELFDDRRPGVYTHISQHVVAQKRLNTGYNKCFLSEENKGFRRLYLQGDHIHESRRSNPQTLPNRIDLPSRYLYLLDWYLDSTDGIQPVSTLNDNRGMDSVSHLTSNHIDDEWFTLSNFVKSFNRAYENFYQSNASYRYFKKGPCIHFHNKAINIWKKNIYSKKADYVSILSDDNYLEAIYATLTAWGMNSLIGGPKLIDYDLFKKNLISISDNLEEIRGLNILTIHEAKETVKIIYSCVNPSENVRNLIAKSKTLHHLHPDIFPPIDNSYTLNLLTKLKDLESRPNKTGVDFENFWKVLRCFQDIINQVGEKIIEGYIGKGIMDTSLTKIVDNAIVGFSDLSLE